MISDMATHDIRERFGKKDTARYGEVNGGQQTMM